MMRNKFFLAVFSLILISGCGSPPAAPSAADRMYYDAYTYIGANDYEASIDLLSRIIEMDSGYTDAYILRAIAYEHENLYDTARQDLLSAEAKDPNNYLVHYNLGNVYLALKDSDSAVKQYTLSISLNQKHAFSYLNRASAYITLKKWKEALNDYRTFTTLSDDQKESILKVISILEKRV
jgi:tetratricopeptide (TPR) repeat protein